MNDREANPVQDKPAEHGIRLSNALLTIAVLLMGWTAKNIDEIKHDVGRAITTAEVNRVETNRNRKDIERVERRVDKIEDKQNKDERHIRR